MRIILALILLCSISGCQDFDKSRYVTKEQNRRDTRHNYPFISGDLFRQISDHIVDDTHIPFDPKNVKERDLVFVKTKYLRRFVKYMHPKIKQPYILITHNGDEEIPGKFEKLLRDKKIIKWYGMNVVKSHTKLVALPIGFGNLEHAEMLAQLGQLPIEKERLLYLNFNNTHPEREEALLFFRQLPYCEIDTCTSKPYGAYMAEVARSKFQVSPRGNGYDCHRVWESIYAGTIPLLRSTPLDSFYEGLPVLIVKDWSEITESFLEQKYVEITSKEYDQTKCFADYWLNMIAQESGKTLSDRLQETQDFIKR